MERCPRCYRYHKGICCIPGYSTLHSPGLAPTRVRSIRSSGKVGSYDKIAERRKAVQKQVKQETLLETLLEKNREWQVTKKGLLKQVPKETPEFSQLQERLEKLMDNEVALLRQLISRG